MSLECRIVSPSDIQTELGRIWDSFQGTSKMRASLFNLIFFTEQTPRTDYIRTIAHKVIEKFPSRVIFITSDTNAKEDFIQTGVSVLPVGNAESDIACDLIDIHVSKQNEKKVPFLILPHILTDLPIYVVWAKDPSIQDTLLQQLEKMASRLIFDSECSEKLHDFATTLLNIYQDSKTDIADLNWARMESWRDLLSSTFYTEERLDQLKKTKNIQIFYNGLGSESYCHTLLQSIYLQGWLACQLDWKLIKADAQKAQFSFLYQKPGGQVEVTLYPEQHQGIHPGAIVSVDLTTEDEDHFSFGRDLQFPHQVSMRFSTLDRCAIPLKYFFAKAESGQSLVKEISNKGTSAHYLKLLKLLKSDVFNKSLGR